MVVTAAAAVVGRKIGTGPERRVHRARGILARTPNPKPKRHTEAIGNGPNMALYGALACLQSPLPSPTQLPSIASSLLETICGSQSISSQAVSAFVVYPAKVAHTRKRDVLHQDRMNLQVFPDLDGQAASYSWVGEMDSSTFRAQSLETCHTVNFLFLELLYLR